MISITIKILHAGPLVSIQDAGRYGALGFGIAASGPMDRAAFVRAGQLINTEAQTALEIAGGRLVFEISSNSIWAGFSGAGFKLKVNDKKRRWNKPCHLYGGDVVEITPAASGNYAYVRFDMEMDVPIIVGSRATNTIAGLGGLNGSLIKQGDEIVLVEPMEAPHGATGNDIVALNSDQAGPIRFIWGIHADLFSSELRRNFIASPFVISPRLDRMGVRLSDPDAVFCRHEILSLVSDAVVPGDMQILGDGSAIVLMRDHQPTGGYPRIATLISADLDRFAQLRPGASVRFLPVSVDHAHKILKEERQK
ncbi:Allophanate hydrolase 2 subunit 2 [hydrothermal vent metagenome]|uniref:Allophanate hydrolase 2 subunit 2 n=1 Tax=hydrothermal vent metagenome TaxID=652676 RepID=A0A3B0TWA2_9ZZZZ